MDKVLVEVTNKDAVYVDGHRITNRSTKWGYHDIVDSFECQLSNVVIFLYNKGYKDVLDKIDEQPYVEQWRALKDAILL